MLDGFCFRNAKGKEPGARSRGEELPEGLVRTTVQSSVTRTRWAVSPWLQSEMDKERGRERGFWDSGGVSQERARRDLQRVSLREDAEASATPIGCSLLYPF